MLLCGLMGGFDSALHAGANSFFHTLSLLYHASTRVADEQSADYK
jgi:hypothetical protein